MSTINWLRVLTGGLLAGLIINVSGMALGHFVLGREYVEAFKAKFPPSSELMMIVQHVGMRLWFGVLAVLLYAAIRPRFGPGPRTALLAGVFLFCSVGLVLLQTLHMLGLLQGGKLGVAVAWTLGEFCVATLAGARVYRE